MQQREQDLADTVVASFAGTPDDRLRTIVTAFARHLHEFATEVRLTEAEWRAGIDFLTAIGHITDDKRQEFILLSDVLGLSMQVVTINAPDDDRVTESTVLGPFFVDDAPQVENGGDIAFGASGEPCWVEGVIRDADGRPVAGARLDVWESDDAGRYDVQYEGRALAGRAQLVADSAGQYRFWALTPTPYPVPDDGPVGRLIAATARSPMRAPHLHVRVAAPGYRTLTTHIFVAGVDADHDSVFGVRNSLIKEFERHGADVRPPDGRGVDSTWTSTRFDIVLARDGAAGSSDKLIGRGRGDEEQVGFGRR